MSSEIAIIVQARMNSSRLPGKMIKPFFGNIGIYELLISKIRNVFRDTLLVVSTTNRSDDDVLVNIAMKYDIPCFRGSENNVLERFIQCAEEYQISKMIRVCADNPFLNLRALSELMIIASRGKYDYISYQTSSFTPTIKTHYGLWAEFVNTTALIKVKSSTTDSKHLEHVTSYIYDNKSEFSIKFINIPLEIEEYPQLRFTLDTPEDFDVLRNLYPEFHDFSGAPLDLIKRVAVNTRAINLMKTQIEKNKK